MSQNEKIVKEIRDSYKEKEPSRVDELIRLNNRVSLPAYIFAYSFGVFGALVLGLGMCLAMQVIGKGIIGMVIGIIVGIIGLIGCGVNYPIYKKMLEKGKTKYAYEIVQLAREISEN